MKPGTSGTALEACDNIRHTLYYLIDLMRSELTGQQGSCAWLAAEAKPQRRKGIEEVE
jgi:hypothetical protein